MPGQQDVSCMKTGMCMFIYDVILAVKNIKDIKNSHIYLYFIFFVRYIYLKELWASVFEHVPVSPKCLCTKKLFRKCIYSTNNRMQAMYM